MCTFKTLYYEEDGYLVFCSDCMHFQLAFQTSLLTLSARDLHVLQTLVKESYESYRFESGPCKKSIYIPTPLEGYGLILDQAELTQLFHLLETAEINYKAESLLELFKTV